MSSKVNVLLRICGSIAPELMGGDHDGVAEAVTETLASVGMPSGEQADLETISVETLELGLGGDVHATLGLLFRAEDDANWERIEHSLRRDYAELSGQVPALSLGAERGVSFARCDVVSFQFTDSR